MNEHDDTLAQLFAEDEPDADREAFVVAVRRRVAVQRRRETAVRIGLIVSGVAVAAVAIALVPESLLNPMVLLYRFASSEVTFGAGIFVAAGLAWWSRFADAA